MLHIIFLTGHWCWRTGWGKHINFPELLTLLTGWLRDLTQHTQKASRLDRRYALRKCVFLEFWSSSKKGCEAAISVGRVYVMVQRNLEQLKVLYCLGSIFFIFLPLMISRVSHCGMHVQSAQTKINNFISFFRNIKLTLVVTNKKCDSHKVMYYRIYIIAMTAKFTGLVWALFRRRWLVSQKYQQPNNNAVSAHCSHNDYLMRSCFASATGCSTHLSA